jgi:hypothetical protein
MSDDDGKPPEPKNLTTCPTCGGKGVIPFETDEDKRQHDMAALRAGKKIRLRPRLRDPADYGVTTSPRLREMPEPPEPTP